MVTTKDYISTVKYLEKLFNFCNEKLFNNELIQPVITAQVDSKNKTNGWFTLSKVWRQNAEDEGAHEINITAQQLNRPIKQVAETMIHEMCHLYARLHNMQDTSRSGTYHNKLFKKIAEMHGLTVKCVQTSGWAVTELSPDTDILISSFIEYNPFEGFIYRDPIFKGQSVKTSSTRKYICPVCGMSVRATKQVRVKCVDCDELMQVEE